MNLDNLPDGFTANLVMGSVITFVSVALYRILHRLHVAPVEVSRINFEELLLDDRTGKMSATKVGYIFSLAVASWVVIFMSFRGTLTDAMYLCYVGATIGPLITKIAKGNPDDPQPPPAGPTTTVTAAGDVTVKPQ